MRVDAVHFWDQAIANRVVFSHYSTVYTRMIAVIIETSYDNVNVIQEILADAKVLN